MTTRGRSLSLTLLGVLSQVLSLAANVLTVCEQILLGHSEDVGLSHKKVNLSLQNRCHRSVAGLGKAPKLAT